MAESKQSSGQLPGLGSPIGGRAGIPARQREQIEKLQALLEKGIEHIRNNEVDEARAIFRGVLTQNPNQPDALNLLGTLEATQGELMQGLELIYRAAMLRPRDPVILNNLGHTFSKLYKSEDAIKYLERAVAINPEFIEALNNLGSAYRMAGRPQDATICFESLVEHHPDRPGGYVGLARLLHDEGKLTEAEELIRKGMEKSPTNGAGFAALAQVKKFKEAPPELEKMEELASPDEKGGAERKGLLFSLGKIFDDMGDYEKAFHYFERANAAVEAESDVTQFVNHVDKIISVFTEEFFAERQDYGCESNRPIFIVGMPRSGTTLLEQIVSSHPQIYGAGELEYLNKLAQKSVEYCELHPTLAPEYPSNMLYMSKMGVEFLARSYLWDIKRHSTNADFVTDKMPHNFQNVGLVALLFPNVKIIHSKRSAMDNCLSIYTQSFNDFHAYKKDLSSLGTYYTHYMRLMDHWEKVLPDRVLEVKYEDLVADQEGKSREIIDYLDLPWADECLTYYKAARSVLTASRWQVRQPIYKGSVERWRNYETHLQPLLEALGDVT